jgi:peptidoglycan/LPS O-acetylase OafA/YrhL
MQSFSQRFKRITDSTTYLPEVDGLRFVAIFLVVAVMHTWNYINVALNHRLLLNHYWRSQILEAGFGVAFFYMISGFILSQPFIKMYQHQGKKVSVKHYYLRRLTRLEPPYFIALILFFIAYVWVLHRYSFGELFPNLITSAFYLNGPLHQDKSIILPVAWSLEVEVQFYLLAPLFFQTFRIKSAYIRWGLYLLVIGVGTYFWPKEQFPYVFTVLHFFFTGVLLSDLYHNRVVLIRHPYGGLIIGLVALAGIFFIPALGSYAGLGFKMICMFLFFHLVLANPYLKRIFSWKWIPIIGGMCYSIYLLHFGVISVTGKLWEHLFPSLNGIAGSLLAYFVLLGMILAVSSIYFLLIEKPFMKPFRLRKAFKKI